MKKNKPTTINLFGYQLSWGRRDWETKDFKWFYSPLIQTCKKGFVFFWWFGHHTYIVLARRKR